MAEQRESVKKQTLVLIRWLAIAGQFSTIMIVHVGFGFTVPILAASAIIGTSIVLNLIQMLFIKQAWLSSREAAAYFGFDVVQLIALLYVTGGLDNPFSVLILAPIAVAATLLTVREMVLLSILAIAGLVFLFITALPLPWDGHPLHLPWLYKIGILCSLVLGVVFFSYYLTRVQKDSARLRDALALREYALADARERASLGALVAHAAHELGSPLNTIAIVAKELQRDMPPDMPWHEDIQLLISQSERCRETLRRLGQMGRQSDSPPPIVALSSIVEQAMAKFSSLLPTMRVDVLTPQEDMPSLPLEPALLVGLDMLLQNARQFATSLVLIQLEWTPTLIRVHILDDGSGFPPDVLERVGEPFQSTRSGQDGHMGLGLFIAKTLLEKTGAALYVTNRKDTSGAHITLVWHDDEQYPAYR